MGVRGTGRVDSAGPVFGKVVDHVVGRGSGRDSKRGGLLVGRVAGEREGRCSACSKGNRGMIITREVVTNLCKEIGDLRKALVDKVRSRRVCSAWWSASARTDVVRVLTVWDFGAAIWMRRVSACHFFGIRCGLEARVM